MIISAFSENDIIDSRTYRYVIGCCCLIGTVYFYIQMLQYHKSHIPVSELSRYAHCPIKLRIAFLGSLSSEGLE